MRSLSVMLLLLTAGCSQFENVTLDEVRAAENKRSEGYIAMSIPGMQQALHDYAVSCRSLGSLTVEPLNPGRAAYTVAMPGYGNSNTVVRIDLQQIGTNTRYQAYTNDETWRNQMEEALYVMSGGKECRGSGPAPQRQ